jgi:uncharacterized protein YkwD
VDTFLVAVPVRTCARLAAGTALICAALSLGGTAVAEAQGCRGANSSAIQVKATLCLINVQRRARGLAPLTANATLARAARHHAVDMVLRNYFAHISPGGSTPVARLRRVGYLRPGCAWSTGETLAWGLGAQATPAGTVAAWMHSPPHRAVLLARGFREVGLGATGGVPGNRGAGVTYVGEFGRRRC